MRTYQLALPLMALALTMVFVDKTAAAADCPPNQVPGCNPCGMPHCSDIANPPRYICLGCMLDGCICKPGYYFQDDKCVPTSQCRIKCPENTVFKACSKTPIACGQLFSKEENAKPCAPRCVCKPGYILSKEGSKECIPIRKCKGSGHSRPDVYTSDQ
ncbi:zonadhesin-like [Rana temporaria]|uniref:zonadhesin-like n=1 Tax=Rana temporaria TaxID=8407 RepID=UPI001AAD55C3|nr:zonadhesin-like [Rana temporaria]